MSDEAKQAARDWRCIRSDLRVTDDVREGFAEGYDAATAKLREELEHECICHAACGVIAMSNTRETLEANRKIHKDYLSASVQDCINAVEREIKLREELERAKREVQAEIAKRFL